LKNWERLGYEGKNPQRVVVPNDDNDNLCLGLPSGLFPSGFSTKTLYMLLLLEEIMDIILQ